MTARLIFTGKASTISAQLAAMQSLGLVPGGPKIITDKEVLHHAIARERLTLIIGGQPRLRLATLDGERT